MAVATLTLQQCKEWFEQPVLARIAEIEYGPLKVFIKYVFARAGYAVDADTTHAPPTIDLRIFAGGEIRGRPAGFIQVRPSTLEGRIRQVAFQQLEQIAATAPVYVITPSDFAAPVHEQTSERSRVRLVNGDRLRRYIQYVWGTRLEDSSGPAVALDHLYEADRVFRRAPDQTKVLALANNKGGVGKTTTALNLAFGLMQAGKRVLVVDLDAQANLTRSLPYVHSDAAVPPTLTEFFSVKRPLAQLVRPTQFDRLAIIPSDAGLQLVHPDMGDWPVEELRFFGALHNEEVKPPHDTNAFDWILLDTPPAMSLTTRAAVAAAHYLLAPANASAFADPGLRNLFTTVDAMHALMGTHVRMLGIVATQWEDKAVVEDALAQLQDRLLARTGIPLLKTKIPHDLKIDQAHLELGEGKGRSLFRITRRGAAAAYERLLQEVLEHVDNA
jgi:chromosome partitioning protein